MKRNLLLFIILISWLGEKALAQQCFKAYDENNREVNVFCVGSKIRFKDCSGLVQPDQEYYDFDKSNGLQFPDTVKTHIYTKAGTYTVTQLANIPGKPGLYERTFQVVATPKPQFIASACGSNRVNVRITDTVYDIFEISFGDGTKTIVAKGSSTTHSYITPGPYNIRVTASYNQASCNVPKDTIINSLPVVKKPKIQNLKVLTASDKGTIEITFNEAQAEYQYILEIENQPGSGFIPTDTIRNIKQSTYTHLANSVDTRTSKCFRLKVIDFCGNNLNTFSNVVCSLASDVTANNKRNTITWLTSQNTAEIQSYSIIRNGQVLSTRSSLTTSFDDTNVACGKNYCYKVEALLVGGTTSSSFEKCVKTISNVNPAKGQLHSSFNLENEVILTFSVPNNETFKEQTISKSLNGSAFTFLAKTNNPLFTDRTFSLTSGNPCYQVTYEDSCGFTSPSSNISCPVVLKGQYDGLSKLELEWTNYEGFQSGVDKVFIEQLDHQGKLLSTLQVNGNKFVELNYENQNQIILFRIRTQEKNTQQVTYSNSFTVIQKFEVYFPNAFTPNGDGLNDVFEPKGNFIDKFNLKVYDRWGNMIYESTSPQNGWDGKLKGKDAPTGTYAYSVEAFDLSGKRFFKTATFSLIR